MSTSANSNEESYTILLLNVHTNTYLSAGSNKNSNLREVTLDRTSGSKLNPAAFTPGKILTYDERSIKMKNIAYGGEVQHYWNYGSQHQWTLIPRKCFWYYFIEHECYREPLISAKELNSKEFSVRTWCCNKEKPREGFWSLILHPSGHYILEQSVSHFLCASDDSPDGVHVRQWYPDYRDQIYELTDDSTALIILHQSL
ncbi:uncharacterized protein LOC129740254 [Uranotaenia lowii]|uniref:uncharacterized protein LOC129740254 n=1 Tax=Uranotaenia lowii TaxID=190385 RepID=UPI0024793D94|nr:uncharacterized protein LOC129740254 [Uranotaenia lowii]